MPERPAARSVHRAVLAVAVAATVLPGGFTPAHAAPPWLTRLNEVRAQVGLRPVAEDTRLAGGIQDHSRYIVKTDDYQHGEDRSSAYYTPSGHAAGNRSNIAVRAGGRGSGVDDVEQWLRAPFHALALLHPGLRATGYASYYEERSPGYTYAAGIDVLSHRDHSAAASYPVTFPAAGMVLPTSMTTAADETPDPLAPCHYSLPAGLPIIMTFGRVADPTVSSYSLTRDGTPVEACATSHASYRGVARSALAENGSVLVIPRAPLAPGSSYTATATVSGVTESVTFSVARVASAVSVATTAGELDCGQGLDVVARLHPGWGGASRQTLQLWGRPAGTGDPWELLRSTVTGRDGDAHFNGLKPSASTDYQVRFEGNSANLPSRSAVRTVTVNRKPWEVQPRRTDHTYVQADSMVLTGDSGLGGGARLLLQERSGLAEGAEDAEWRQTGSTAVADEAGYFELRTVLDRPGRYVFRVVALSAGCHTAGVSEPVTVTVLLNTTTH